MNRYQQNMISQLGRFLGTLLVFLLFSFNVNSVFADAPAWLRGVQDKAVYSSKHVRAELVANAPQGIAPETEVWLGLKIEHQPEWHTYWKNPGDVGAPTELNWTLPPGVSASEIHWPTPGVLVIGDDIIDYGYEGTILLPVKLIVSDKFQGNTLEVQLQASWLVCRIECIPEQANFTLSIPTQQSTVSDAALFESTRKSTPVVLEGVVAQVLIQPLSAEQTTAQKDDERELVWVVSGLPSSWQGQNIRLFPEQKDVIVNTGPRAVAWENGVWVAHYALNQNRIIEPEQLSAVLVLESNQSVDEQERFDVRVLASVSGAWPNQEIYEIPPSLWEGQDAAAQTPAMPDGETMAVGSSPEKSSLLLILGFAFLGGLLLNLMPCVFPVLSMTVLSFASSAEQDERMKRRGGLAYGAGTILTMLLLAVLLLLLRAGGAALGWGFQLQSPLFVSFMAALFLLVALNLLGVFEIQLFLPQGVSDLKSENSSLNSFFSGVVAVLVATPCTAPFMGAALGATLVMPAWQTLLVFLFLGVGLSVPLVLLTFVPQMMRWLPRPGAWMLTFKQLMAFPMLAAVLWLVWVASVQIGADGAIELLLLLLAVAFFAWVLGWLQRTTLKLRCWKLCALLLALLCLGGALYTFVSQVQQNKDVEATAGSARNASSESTAGAMQWEDWSAERVNMYLAQGKVVFVDFTAAWCVTCQMNKKTTLSNQAVLKAFADKGVVLMRADWTKYDPLITAELARLGRNGVPVYAFYKEGQAPQLLPEVLTPQVVYTGLDRFFE